MKFWAVVAFLIQGGVMGVDEWVFHRRRGLGSWERLGHPVDTGAFALCLLWTCAVRPAVPSLRVYILLSVISCLLITKDEFVHARVCAPAEHWLHACLFVLHPVALGMAGWLWWQDEGRELLVPATVGAVVFAIYQVAYWGGFKGEWRALHHRTK